MTIHDTMMAVPPTPGAQAKTAATVLPGSSDEPAATARRSGTYFGMFDHGPVHSTTMTMSTMIGSQAWKISRPVRPCSALVRASVGAGQRRAAIAAHRSPAAKL